jgi:DNA-binding phage protein
MTEAAKQIGMSRTALYRFLDGAPIHSDHFDAISAWIERQPQ